VTLAAFSSAGCGQSDDRAVVRSVTEHFLAAVASGDGTTACAQLSVDARGALEDQEKRACRDAVTQLALGNGTPTRIQVYLTSAKVDLSGGQSTFLSRGRQGWRISAVGCRPDGAKPADRPYHCELQA
jgi:hypothetical protein